MEFPQLAATFRLDAAFCGCSFHLDFILAQSSSLIEQPEFEKTEFESLLSDYTWVSVAATAAPYRP